MWLCSISGMNLGQDRLKITDKDMSNLKINHKRSAFGKRMTLHENKMEALNLSNVVKPYL